MDSKLQLLTDILHRTRDGRLRWRQVKPDEFEAPLPKGVVSIRFHYPMMGDERVSGADLAAVSIGNVLMHFFSGTDGMSLVVQILSAGLPEWQKHTGSIEQKLAEARALLATD